MHFYYYYLNEYIIYTHLIESLNVTKHFTYVVSINYFLLFVC